MDGQAAMDGRGQAGALDITAIEAEAARALSAVPEWIWDGKTFPLPLEAIVDSHYMLLVREVEDFSRAPGFPATEDAAISGLLLTSLGEIWVSSDEARQWPARRRFTVGHELGHWLMHRTGQQSMFCRHANVDQPHPDQLRLETGSGGIEPANELSGGHSPVGSMPPPVGSMPPGEDRVLPLFEAEANAFAAAALMPIERFRFEHMKSDGDLDHLQRFFGCSEKATQRRIRAVIG